MIFAMSLFALAYANRYAAEHGGHDLSGFFVLALVPLAMSIGLWFRWKPAVVAYLFATFSAALWLGIGSIVSVPFPWWVLNLVLGVLILVLPGIVLLGNWHRLRRATDRSIDTHPCDS